MTCWYFYFRLNREKLRIAMEEVLDYKRKMVQILNLDGMSFHKKIDPRDVSCWSSTFDWLNVVITLHAAPHKSKVSEQIECIWLGWDAPVCGWKVWQNTQWKGSHHDPIQFCWRRTHSIHFFYRFQQTQRSQSLFNETLSKHSHFPFNNRSIHLNFELIVVVVDDDVVIDAL